MSQDSLGYEIDDSALFHGTYDPVKAREYYLRTRKLKGRQHGSPRVTGDTRGRAGVSGAPNRANTKSRHAELEAQKKALEKRLEHLRKVLAHLVDAAKKRSGVDHHEKGKAKETQADKADRNAASKKSKPETAAEKKKRAKKAKDAYEKEHPNSLSEDVDILKVQVEDIRKKIQDALDKARERRSKAGMNNSKSGSMNNSSGSKGR